MLAAVITERNNTVKIQKLDRRYRNHHKGMRYRVSWSRTQDRNITGFQQTALCRFRTAENIAKRFFGNHYMTHNRCEVTWITSSALGRSDTEFWIDVQTQDQVLLLQMADCCVVVDHSALPQTTSVVHNL